MNVENFALMMCFATAPPALSANNALCFDIVDKKKTT